MLVVVHNRDVAFFFEAFFDFKAFGRFDVLKVDAAEGRGESFHYFHKPRGVFFVDFDVETVESGKNLEQQCLSLHDGLTGFCTYVAKS